MVIAASGWLFASRISAFFEAERARVFAEMYFQSERSRQASAVAIRQEPL